VVLAESGAVEPAAKALARAIYQDARLRPNIDEPVARVLLGAAASEGDAQQRELAEVVAALRAGEAPVRRRLLSSLGEELNCELVVLVGGSADKPRARVLRVSESRLLGVVLAADRAEPDTAARTWRDGVALLRGLLHGPAPGPRSAAAPAPTQATQQATQAARAEPAQPPAKRRPSNRQTAATPGAEPVVADDDDGDVDLLTSPWFWAGLGTVMAVGVTVLVLSQTALNEPDTVLLEGRVGP
jgi:hypothetical protein